MRVPAENEDEGYNDDGNKAINKVSLITVDAMFAVCILSPTFHNFLGILMKRKSKTLWLDN